MSTGAINPNAGNEATNPAANPEQSPQQQSPTTVFEQKIELFDKAAGVTAKSVERLGLPTFLLIILTICICYAIVVGGSTVWKDLVLPARDNHFKFMDATAETQRKNAETTAKIEQLLSKQEAANVEHRAITEKVRTSVDKVQTDVEAIKTKLFAMFFGAGIDPKKPKPNDQGGLTP